MIQAFINEDTEAVKFLTEIFTLNKSKNISENKTTFSTAECTQCPRRLIYKSLCYIEDIDDSSYSSWYDVKQNHVKNIWKNKFLGTDKIILKDNSVNVYDARLNLSGTVDLVINIPDVDVKSFPVMVYAVESCMKTVIRSNIIETMINAWLMDYKNAILIYQDHDYHKIYQISVYKPIIDSIEKKFSDLVKYKIRGAIPKRPVKTQEESQECGTCNYKKRCWENIKNG